MPMVLDLSPPRDCSGLTAWATFKPPTVTAMVAWNPVNLFPTSMAMAVCGMRALIISTIAQCLNSSIRGRSVFGCMSVGKNSRGANWTDLSLSTTAPAINWPDDNGPEIPNNATFIFDFTVKKDRIAEGAQIFFNLVYADYDVNPATIRVEFANGKVQNLALENTASFGFDGLIEARTAFFSFTDVFSPDAEGNWKGFASVIFLAPFEPWTAFDFVEMSLVGLS